MESWKIKTKYIDETDNILYYTIILLYSYIQGKLKKHTKFYPQDEDEDALLQGIIFQSDKIKDVLNELELIINIQKYKV